MGCHEDESVNTHISWDPLSSQLSPQGVEEQALTEGVINTHTPPLCPKDTLSIKHTEIQM